MRVQTHQVHVNILHQRLPEGKGMRTAGDAVPYLKGHITHVSPEDLLAKMPALVAVHFIAHGSSPVEIAQIR